MVLKRFSLILSVNLHTPMCVLFSDHYRRGVTMHSTHNAIHDEGLTIHKAIPCTMSGCRFSIFLPFPLLFDY